MKRTRQDTVTLVGLGDGFEIWPTEDYQRIEKKSEKQLCDFCSFWRMKRTEYPLLTPTKV